MSVQVKKVSRVVHETGLEGGDREDVFYELGAEIDGVWVPFSTVSEHRIADFRARSEADAANGKSSSKRGKTNDGNDG
jgi:hypothetical protein